MRISQFEIYYRPAYLPLQKFLEKVDGVLNAN